MVSSGLDSKELKSYKFAMYILVDDRFGFFQQPYQHRGKVKGGGGWGVTLCQTEGTRQFLLPEYCKYFA